MERKEGYYWVKHIYNGWFIAWYDKNGDWEVNREYLLEDLLEEINENRILSPDESN